MKTYLIVSETLYFIEEKLKELKNGIDNIITFNMEENSMSEVLEEASYFSMFNEEKCIIVKNAKIFGSSKNSDSNKNKEDMNKLLKYLNNENKNTKLIFIYNGKVDSKKKIYNIIKDNNNVYLYNKMTRTEMKNELLKIANNNKYKIEDKSLWYIINNSLDNFDISINELKKVIIYNNNDYNIKYEDVVNLTSHSFSENNFKLVDSIIIKDFDNAIKYLNDSKVLKIEPSVILSLIYREFKLMLSVILYEKNKYNINEILSNLRLANWQYEKVKNNLRLYNEREIKEEIVKLSKIDYKYKSGLCNKDVILINYIIDLCC